MSAARGFFWVGVEPVASDGGTVPANQMFVEWLAPEEVRRPHPIVLVHGGGGQGTDWLGTPDGRPGWAPMLVQDGFAVYVVDRSGHGRSPYVAELLGPAGPPAPYEVLRDVFHGPPDSPIAAGHTQWPGEWAPGDPATDQFMAGTAPMRLDAAAGQALDGRCLAQLLDRIGPAILVSHSASGPAGWIAADARPDQVATLVAIEPIAPPFLDAPPMGVSLTWGLSGAPLTYAPAVDDPQVQLHDGSPRTLENLARVKIVVVSAEHSLMGTAAASVVAFLSDHGCAPEHLRLEDHGITGNGHGMMLERNNREVLDLLVSRLEDRGAA
jgi:pimeloyl-ACP methyl ester carboxylesterase